VLRTLAPLLAAAVAGCASPPTGFESPVPAARLDAITHAAETRDGASVPELISMLESDDPLVRLASIRTLQRITGTDLGYDYAAPDWKRREGVAAWVDWYTQNGPRTAPGASGSAVSRSSGRPMADSVEAESPQPP
jgi:hypothetical protein